MTLIHKTILEYIHNKCVSLFSAKQQTCLCCDSAPQPANVWFQRVWLWNLCFQVSELPLTLLLEVIFVLWQHFSCCSAVCSAGAAGAAGSRAASGATQDRQPLKKAKTPQGRLDSSEEKSKDALESKNYTSQNENCKEGGILLYCVWESNS